VIVIVVVAAMAIAEDTVIEIVAMKEEAEGVATVGGAEQSSVKAAPFTHSQNFLSRNRYS